MEPRLGGGGGGGARLPLPHIHPCLFSSFCQQYPELLVASYNNNEDAPHEPDGVALVWNMKYKKATPEYVFHCQVPKVPPCLFVPQLSTSSPGGFFHGKHGALPAPLAPLLHNTPLAPPPLLLPSCTYWHPPTPHLSTNTCS